MIDADWPKKETWAMHQEPDIKQLWAMARVRGVLLRSGSSAISADALAPGDLTCSGLVDSLQSEGAGLALPADEADQSAVVNTSSAGDSPPGVAVLDTSQTCLQGHGVDAHSDSLGIFVIARNRRMRYQKSGSIETMSDSTESILADNIRTLMREANPRMNQKDVSAKTGIDQTTVGRVLSLTNSPTVRVVQALANGLMVKPWQLLMPDLGRRINPDQSGLSAVAVRLAEKFDAIGSIEDKRVAFAYLAQVLDFAAFRSPQSTGGGFPPFPEPTTAPPRTRRKRREPSL